VTTDERGARGFSTRAVHTGERPPHPDFFPSTTPIYATTSFSYEDSGTLDPIFAQEREGYVYSRYGNPTTAALEAVIADLESGEAAVMCASGMAAIYASLLLDLKSGDRLVAAPDVYGATYAILHDLLPRLGIETTFVDFRDLNAVHEVVTTTRPKKLICETISNPLIKVADVAALATIAHAADALLIVDNTFPTPVLCRPLELGADLVIHSTTKYFAGHGDSTGGAIVTTRERADQLRLQQRLLGDIISPFESYLTLRGIKTLPLRYERQCENAGRIAGWLAEHPRVAHVNYPAFVNLGAAAEQFLSDQRGAMLSFDIRDAGEADVNRFMDALSLIVPATTLGDVFSLVLYPANTSHRALPPEAREAIGIGPGLVRLSAGIEDADDIIADLDRALAAI